MPGTNGTLLRRRRYMPTERLPQQLPHHQLFLFLFQLLHHRIPGLLDPLQYHRFPALLHLATRRHPKSSAAPVLNLQPAPEEGPRPHVATRSTAQLERCGALRRIPAATDYVISLKAMHRIPEMAGAMQALWVRMPGFPMHLQRIPCCHRLLMPARGPQRSSSRCRHRLPVIAG